MGLLTFGLNVTLDGCIDHTQGIVDDELHDYWTQLMDQSGAMLFGRNTYELMEGAWPAVARDEKAPRAMREWALKLETKAKYVVSGSLERAEWNNSTIVRDDVIERVRALREEQNLLVWGSPTLVQTLMDHGLVDEFVLLVSPIVRGEGIRLFRDAGSQHDLRIAESTVLGGGMLALRMTPARA